jgi:L-aminopeptidase/D-esterase-like protein
MKGISMPLSNSITDVPGIWVGQAQDMQAATGCTVILCKRQSTGGVDQRGGAPGTRETDALRPMHLVDQVHAVLLAGGSAFGLNAAAGVMRYLEENGVGFNTGVARVPIVPAAVIFDLGIGRSDIRPDAEMAYQACRTASANPPEQGSVGAGTGATVGKILGMGSAVKSGIGTASLEIGGGIFVGALVVVNAFGDVVDPDSGKIIAGARPLQKGLLKIGGEGKFADTLEVMRSFAGRTILGFMAGQNTVIGVIATNARLNTEETNKIAQMAQNGVALSVRPAHTMLDGDTMFAIATNERKADVNIVGAFATQVVAKAIVNAVQNAKSLGGIPSITDL